MVKISTIRHQHIHVHVQYNVYGLVNLGLVHATQMKMTIMVAAYWLRSQDYLNSPTTLALTQVKPINLYVVYFIMPRWVEPQMQYGSRRVCVRLSFNCCFYAAAEN